MQKPPLTFVEDPSHKMRPEFLDEKTQEIVSRSRINVCVDVVIMDRRAKTFSLVRRTIRPMQGLWWFGGGMKAGDDPAESAAKILKREASIVISPERFIFLDIHNVRWKDRQEIPQDAGRHDLTFMYGIELAPEEREAMARGIERVEYDPSYGLKEFDYEGLSKAGAHPIILETYSGAFAA